MSNQDPEIFTSGLMTIFLVLSTLVSDDPVQVTASCSSHALTIISAALVPGVLRTDVKPSASQISAEDQSHPGGI